MVIGSGGNRSKDLGGNVEVFAFLVVTSPYLVALLPRSPQRLGKRNVVVERSTVPNLNARLESGPTALGRKAR